MSHLNRIRNQGRGGGKNKKVNRRPSQMTEREIAQAEKDDKSGTKKCSCGSGSVADGYKKVKGQLVMQYKKCSFCSGTGRVPK
jgi:hypothetical protein